MSTIDLTKRVLNSEADILLSRDRETGALTILVRVEQSAALEDADRRRTIELTSAELITRTSALLRQKGYEVAPLTEENTPATSDGKEVLAAASVTSPAGKNDAQVIADFDKATERATQTWMTRTRPGGNPPQGTERRTAGRRGSQGR